MAAFADALAFNWLIGGTDGHAKNDSLLHAGGGGVRLAPLYDLASALPYFHMEERGLKLAMRIGGEYRLANIDGRRWRNLAAELRLDGDETVARIASLASRLPDAVLEVVAEMGARGITHPILERLAEGLPPPSRVTPMKGSPDPRMKLAEAMARARRFCGAVNAACLMSELVRTAVRSGFVIRRRASARSTDRRCLALPFSRCSRNTLPEPVTAMHHSLSWATATSGWADPVSERWGGDAPGQGGAPRPQRRASVAQTAPPAVSIGIPTISIVEPSGAVTRACGLPTQPGGAM